MSVSAALEVLQHADAMAAAAVRVRPLEGEDPAPYLLLQGLATELTLKALLLAVKGRYPRVHALRALWGDLPEAVQERILRLHRGQFRSFHAEASDREADGVLLHLVDAAGDAFHMARYPMEHEVRDVPDPEPLRRVVRGALMALPDVANVDSRLRSWRDESP